jgi:hypothetical protein
MANHAKNIFVGTGGKEAIDKSHFAGAAFGMERMMGRPDTPVRALFDEGMNRFGSKLPPILYALTVVSARSKDEASFRKAGLSPVNANEFNSNEPALRGFFAGFGRDCFEKAAALSRQVNVNLLDEPIKKAVVYLDPEEFRSTWLGNKAVYRTRMAMATGGELLIIAPGLERFGEDPGIDALIRKYGYRPAKIIREKVEAETPPSPKGEGSAAVLSANLSAAAHLIHGSSEGRFTIRYCPGPLLSRSEVESVGYEWGDIAEAEARYNISNTAKKLQPGWNVIKSERIFFVPNPALGLWALRDNFSE